ncbi:8-oxo-dGTP diphosphatase [Marininema halotolerans]|uniref:8-oxo-dGTP diphosphatase n=1 Tax=Marininema halotolerans TaxID=1155944 RepID=A0A1I6NWT2_9BACL|nr:8-oxo-dGTP diphosphatase [Marininema halotolerans]SFS32391.1 8-oxo-dGTP diphosphatase [Marininema halotolerans]
MQRIANCLLQDQDQFLLLKKPRRGWWVAPGGKVESGETIMEAVCREFYEETGLHLIQPVLSGVVTMCVEQDGKIEKEWMMFNFRASHYEGALLENSPEGQLSWQPLDALSTLPTSEMDQQILSRLACFEKELFIGRIVYSPEEVILSQHWHN